MLRVVAILLLAGCDVVFGLEAPDAPSPCPESYDTEVLGSASRYRMISTEDRYDAQHLACLQDLEGQTHLAAIDTLDEAIGLDAIAGALPGPAAYFYVGLRQLRDQPSPGDGWLNVTGQPVPIEAWNSNQPEDSDGVEDNQENVAILNPDAGGGYLQDNNGNGGHGAICECDGLPVIAP